ncbi:MAG: twin-arginine translocase subunit TatC [Bryobacteraceae bacterium]
MAYDPTGDGSSEQSLVPATASPSGWPGSGATPPRKPPVAGSSDDPDDEEENGMLRMSFMDHLEELRLRIIRALMGFAVAFGLCVIFCYQLWDFVRAPATDALRKIGADPELVINEPMEGFSIIWVKVPMVFALFLGSPWVVYQIWAFIAPGLYQREKRMAAPFVLITAGLFILGGAFAYFVAFRYGLAFLLGIGLTGGVKPLVTITHYFDLFVNVMLGVALVFELPVAIFFMTLLHLASPRFLLRHSRYAILCIVILAAVITPTPDFFNLTLFAVPMCLLYFVGVFASFLLVLKREGKKFPWAATIAGVILGLGILGGITYYALTKIGYHWVSQWPFMVK